MVLQLPLLLPVVYRLLFENFNRSTDVLYSCKGDGECLLLAYSDARDGDTMAFLDLPTIAIRLLAESPSLLEEVSEELLSDLLQDVATPRNTKQAEKTTMHITAPTAMRALLTVEKDWSS